MTSLEAYQSFLEKINRNDTNSNVNISRGAFVNLFNQQIKIWLSDKLKKDKATQAQEGLADIREDDVELEFIDVRFDHARFKLPEDFEEVDTSFVLASKDDCKERVLVNWNIKSSEKRLLLQDENTKPSFEYEETISLVNKDMLNVYFTDFTVDKCYLTYFRVPRKIDIEGYIKVDGTPSTTINPDISSSKVEEIVSYCAAEAMRNSQNAEGFQFSKDRLQSQ